MKYLMPFIGYQQNESNITLFHPVCSDLAGIVLFSICFYSLFYNPMRLGQYKQLNYLWSSRTPPAITSLSTTRSSPVRNPPTIRSQRPCTSNIRQTRTMHGKASSQTSHPRATRLTTSTKTSPIRTTRTKTNPNKTTIYTLRPLLPTKETQTTRSPTSTTASTGKPGPASS